MNLFFINESTGFCIIVAYLDPLLSLIQHKITICKSQFAAVVDGNLDLE